LGWGVRCLRIRLGDWLSSSIYYVKAILGFDMGFLSGIFGSNSEWDASNYVSKVAGNKFWHESFIDKDLMKDEGQRVASFLDPLGSSRREQSPDTIVGELLYLLNVCRSRGDNKGIKAVSLAIKHLMENHHEKLIHNGESYLMSYVDTAYWRQDF
jgi:hypothetical protein